MSKLEKMSPHMYLSHQISHILERAGFMIMYTCIISLAPRPPPFLPFICVHTSEEKASEKRVRTESIHHMNDFKWTRGGQWGGGTKLPKQHTGSFARVLYHSFELQTLA